MTFSAFAGIFLTLAIVLGLIAVTMRLLRRVTAGSRAGRGSVRLEVIQRLPLGPRQGIAVVRVGSQVVAVSVGDGGVRALLEVHPEDVLDGSPATNGRASRAFEERDTATRGPSVSPFVGNSLIGTPRQNRPVTAERDFRALLRDGLRSAGVPFALVALCLAVASQEGRAQTPAPPRAAPPTVTRPAPTVRQTTAPVAARPATVPRPQGTTPSIAPNVGALRSTAAVATPAVPAPPSFDQVLSKAPEMDVRVGGSKQEGALHLSGTVGIVVMMGLLTLLPTLLLLMTGFTRILIVLHFLKQAIGAQSAPPASLISALALLLTGFVMTPTLTEVNRTAITPWLDGKIEQGAMISAAIIPFRQFMLRQTRERDLVAFVEMSRSARPKRPEDTPTVVLMSAFVTSELRTAFQLGFALFLPFIVIDVVVSSVLMSMGMMMLPPALISLPFKLLLFVLVDGWTLVIQSLVAGFK